MISAKTSPFSTACCCFSAINNRSKAGNIYCSTSSATGSLQLKWVFIQIELISIPLHLCQFYFIFPGFWLKTCWQRHSTVFSPISRISFVWLANLFSRTLALKHIKQSSLMEHACVEGEKGFTLPSINTNIMENVNITHQTHKSTFESISVWISHYFPRFSFVPRCQKLRFVFIYFHWCIGERIQQKEEEE